MALSLASIGGMSGAELAAYIADVKGMVEGYQNTIGCIRSTLSNPQFVAHSIAAAEQMILRNQAHIANLLDTQAHGHERIAEYKARIVQKEQDLALLFNFAKIVQMAELAAELEEQLGTSKMSLVRKLAAADV